MIRVLVTGGTGFIGRALVSHLVAQPHVEVTLLVREAYAGSQTLPAPLAALRSKYDLVYADLRNFRLTAQAIQRARPDHVIHLAAAGVTDPFLGIDTALRHNLYGTLNLLRACFQQLPELRRVIIGRTPGELSAMNVYAASKAAAWDFCRMYGRTQGWDIVGAMIYQAYGPGQPSHALIPSALESALAGRDLAMTSGQHERDWIWVEEVAAGLHVLLDAELPTCTTVDLGTGELTRVVEIVHQIYALVNRGGRPRPGLLPDRPGEAAQQCADADRTFNLTGWRALLTPTEGLARLIAHQTNHATE